METTDMTTLPMITSEFVTSVADAEPHDLGTNHPAVIVRILGTVIIMILASTGNPLSFIVLRSKRLRNSTTSLLLSFLAIVDLLAVYIAQLPQTIALATGSYVRLRSDFLCKFFWFAPLFLTELSSWVLVLVSVERVVAVWFPIKAKSLRSVKSVGLALIMMTLVLFLINTRYFFTKKLTDGACVPNPPYASFENNASVWLARMTYWGIPCAIMLGCDLLIFVKIRLLRFHGNPEAAGRFHNKTIIMISNTLAFVVCTTPLVVFNITCCGHWYHNTRDFLGTYAVANSFFIILADMNHAINFILYCVAGERFREEFAYVVLRRSRAVFPDPSTSLPQRRSRLESRMEVGLRLDAGFLSHPA